MKATYDPAAKSKFTPSHRKEGKCYFNSYQVITPAPKDKWGQIIMNVMVDLRIYGTGNSNTACIWIHNNEIHTSGSGRAGGYGYHRSSAAAGEAIKNAGFSLSQDINGVGASAIREAMIAIAEELGLENYGLVESCQ